MARKLKVDWLSIREEYLRGGISLRGLAEKHGISQAAIEGQSRRYGWRKQIAEIQRKVAEKVENHLEHCARAWIDDTLHRARRYRHDIDKSRDMMQQAVDPDGLLALIRVEKGADDMARRSLGLPDTPTSVEVKPNGKSLQESIIASFIELKRLHDSGQLDQIIDIDTIDVEKLANEPIEKD